MMLIVASSAGYGATEVGPIAHNGCVNPNVEVGADCMVWTCTHVCIATGAGLPLEVRIVPCVELGHDEGVGYNQNF